jgi:hypothetical protein
MALNMSFRIQITSFAAQTSAAKRHRKRSIRSGDSRARRVGLQKTTHDRPHDGNQLRGEQTCAETFERGQYPTEWQRQNPQGDRSWQYRQGQGYDGNRERGEPRKKARAFAIALDLAGREPTIRVVPDTWGSDSQRLHTPGRRNTPCACATSNCPVMLIENRMN